MDPEESGKATRAAASSDRPAPGPHERSSRRPEPPRPGWTTRTENAPEASEPTRETRTPKTPDPRPFIREAGPLPERPIDAATVTIGMVVLALAIGFVIGFAVFLIMNFSIWLTALIWNGATGDMPTPWFPLVMCTFGGLVIGVWTWWSRDSVRPLEKVMAEFKATGSYRTKGVWKPVVSFLLPLVFGGSVGFEAGLTGLITAGCCWIRDRLKAAGLREAAVAEVTIAASISAIFGTPLAGIVAGAESAPRGKASSLDGTNVSGYRPAGPYADDELLVEPDVDDYTMRRGVKIVLYTAAAFGAFAGIAAFSSLFGAASGLPRFGAIEAAGPEFLWALLCLAAAYLMALIYHGSARFFGNFDRWTKRASRAAISRPVVLGAIGKPILAGLIMGAIACALPLVLFPGETQSEFLMANWANVGAMVLVLTGMFKAAVTPMCLNMGWMGGNFFPSIFAGVAVGYGLAAITGADPMLMVTVTTTAFLAGVIRKPLLCLAILVLCFPATGILWMGLAALIGASLPLPRVLRENGESIRS